MAPFFQKIHFQWKIKIISSFYYYIVALWKTSVAKQKLRVDDVTIIVQSDAICRNGEESSIYQSSCPIFNASACTHQNEIFMKCL